MSRTPNGSSSSRTSACSLRTPGSASTTSATSSTPRDGSSAAAPPGVTCPRTFPPGRWSTSRPAAGSPRDASRRSSTTSAPSSGSPTAATPEPTAAVFDSRTLQSTPESGGRAGYDGAKRKKGSKVHAAVDTLGHLLALHVTPADVQDRDRVAALAEAVQEATGDSVELAYVDQGYTGPEAEIAAADEGIDLAGREAARGEARVRAAAATVGGRSGRSAGRRGSAAWRRTTSG